MNNITLDNSKMWIIVERSILEKYHNSQGNIIRVGLTKEKAEEIAWKESQKYPTSSFWAMTETQFNTPFGE